MYSRLVLNEIVVSSDINLGFFAGQRLAFGKLILGKFLLIRGFQIIN